jgi:2-oxoisovalerate dehydrogenase E1 component
MSNGLETEEARVQFARKIREFEYKVYEEFRAGNIPGSIHCCIGQELDEVEIISQLKEGDILLSNHRSHGHYLAFTKDFEGLMQKIKTAPGAQHLYNNKGFFSNGIQGGLTAIACGMAFAEKRNESSNIVACFIGDGTLGQGLLYESMNIASLWELPLVYIIENNQYAMSTATKNNVSRKVIDQNKSQSINNSIKERFSSFGLHDFSLDRAIDRDKLPGFVLIDTYRYCGHSGNDPLNYRDKEEERKWIKKDRLGGYLLE